MLREAELLDSGIEVVFVGSDTGKEQVRDIKVPASFASSTGQHGDERSDPPGEIRMTPVVARLASSGPWRARRPETVKAFQAIIKEDPDCAIAYWGLAMSELPNPLVPPFPPANLKAGWEAIRQSKAAKIQTPREAEYLAAIEVFYIDYDKIDQKTRAERYEQAMQRLHEHYPEDSEAAMENKLVPIRALLGELYFAAGMNKEALVEFEASDKDMPNRFRIVAGAARAARESGSAEAAKRYYRALTVLAEDGDSKRPEIGEARTYLDQN
jgi:hypothetical protein